MLAIFNNIPDQSIWTAYQHYIKLQGWFNPSGLELMAPKHNGTYACRHWRGTPDYSDANDNYFPHYKLSVDATEETLIKDIENLKKNLKEGLHANLQLNVLLYSLHAYKPLLQARQNCPVRISPVALNKDEADFVEFLVQVVRSEDIDKEIYLMRNLTKGKGISFFDTHSFYPDFILWMKDGKRQDILFIDPKGLQKFDRKTKSKTGLHKQIKETEKKIQKKNPKLFLHSYIWSTTHPQDIGSDKNLTEEELKKSGVFFASNRKSELKELLNHALKN